MAKILHSCFPTQASIQVQIFQHFLKIPRMFDMAKLLMAYQGMHTGWKEMQTQGTLI